MPFVILKKLIHFILLFCMNLNKKRIMFGTHAFLFELIDNVLNDIPLKS
jgi:hypothetical protein